MVKSLIFNIIYIYLKVSFPILEKKSQKEKSKRIKVNRIKTDRIIVNRIIKDNRIKKRTNIYIYTITWKEKRLQKEKSLKKKKKWKKSI